MIDGVIAGTGNSRKMKSSFSGTFQDFLDALAAGTFPFDLNGIDAAGWATLGTALNKANLLSDATAALFLTSPTTVNEALAEAAGRAKFETGSYVGTFNGGALDEDKKSLTFSFAPKVVCITDNTQGATIVLTNSSAWAFVSQEQAALYWCRLTWSGNSVEMDGTRTLNTQTYRSPNLNGRTYYYAVWG